MVFLQILKIIGFVLLGIFGLVLLLLGIVLFVPVRYKGHGVKNDAEMDLDVNVTWLLHLIMIGVHVGKDGLKKEGRIAFYRLFEDKAPKKRKKDKDDTVETHYLKKETEEEAKKEKIPDDAPGDTEIVSETPDFESQPENTTEAVHEENTTPSDTEDESIAESREKVKKKRHKKKRKKRKKSTELTLKGRLLNLFKNRDYISLAIDKKIDSVDKAMERVAKLLKHILPRKLYGSLKFGFDDPSTTGKVLGIISILYGVTGPFLKLEPDFENKVFAADLRFKGKIRIFTVLLLAALVYFNKDLRKLLKYIKHCSEADIDEERYEKHSLKETDEKSKEAVYGE